MNDPVRDLAFMRSSLKQGSNIRFINLQDQIAPHPGIFASYSIISPAITVEHAKEDARISARFQLQADIIGFDAE